MQDMQAQTNTHDEAAETSHDTITVAHSVSASTHDARVAGEPSPRLNSAVVKALAGATEKDSEQTPSRRDRGDASKIQVLEDVTTTTPEPSSSPSVPSVSLSVSSLASKSPSSPATSVPTSVNSTSLDSKYSTTTTTNMTSAYLSQYYPSAREPQNSQPASRALSVCSTASETSSLTSLASCGSAATSVSGLSNSTSSSASVPLATIVQSDIAADSPKARRASVPASASAPVTSGAARKRRKTVTAKDDQAKESARGATPAVARSQEQASKTITAQQSSAAESNGKPVQSPLAGELQNYVNDRYREHPAHKVPCSSTYVQAMSGAFGRDPTRTEIKKGLHTLSEQRRRWSINDGYEQLRSMVPHCASDQGNPISKAAVLSRSANYIGDLTVYIEQLKVAIKDRDDRLTALLDIAEKPPTPSDPRDTHTTRQESTVPGPAPSSRTWEPQYRHIERASDNSRPVERVPVQTTSMAHLRSKSERSTPSQAMSGPIAPQTPRQRSHTTPQIAIDPITAPSYAPPAYAGQGSSAETLNDGQVAPGGQAQFWPATGDSAAQITLYHPTPAPTPLLNQFQFQNLTAMAEESARAPSTASTYQPATQSYGYSGNTAANKRKNPFDAQDGAPAYAGQYQQTQLPPQLGNPHDDAGYAAGYNAYADPANLQSLLTLPYTDNDAVSNERNGTYAYSTASSRQPSPIRAISPLPHPSHDLGTPWYSSDFGVDQRRGQTRAFDFDGQAILLN